MNNFTNFEIMHLTVRLAFSHLGDNIIGTRDYLHYEIVDNGVVVTSGNDYSPSPLRKPSISLTSALELLYMYLATSDIDELPACEQLWIENNQQLYYDIALQLEELE